MLSKVLFALASLALTAVSAHASGDPKAGAVVFKRCAVCHASDKLGGDDLGPNLFGVAGRKAASRSGFAYSGSLQKAGITWTEANLTRWVANPARMVEGTKMGFGGISSKKQQADVVAYLQTLK